MKLNDVNSGLSVCFFDFETTNLDADFGFMMVAGFKPAGKPAYVFRWDDKKYKGKNLWDDKKIVIATRQELEKFDIICGYNSKMFDVRFLNSRLMKHNEVTLRRDIKHIDIYWQIRFKLKLHNSKLETACDYLELPHRKTPLRGEMWVRASHGDKIAIKYICNHCKGDVEALEDVFNRTKNLLKEIK